MLNLSPISRMVGLKAVLIGAPILMAVSAIGGGWAMNEFWLGKNARNNLKAADLVIASRNATIAERDAQLFVERGLRELSDAAVTRLEKELETADDRLNSAQDQTIAALNRIPKDTVRIIEQGEKIGEKLIKDGDNDWIYNVWPSELWNFAFGEIESTGTTAPPELELPLAQSGENPGD